MEDQNIKKESKSIVWGAKVPPELKKEVDEFINDSNLKGADFLNLALNSLKAQQIVQGDHGAAKELQDLEYHLTRAKEIFVERVKKNDDDREQFKAQLEETQQKHNEIISNLNDNIRELKVTIVNQKETLQQIQTENESLAARNEELEEANRVAVKTTSMYEEKIEDLKAQVENLRATGEKYEEAKKEIASQANTINNLQTEVHTQAEDHRKEIEKLTISNEREIATLKLEHESKLLEIKNRHNQEIRNLQDEYADKINELHQKYNERLEVLATQVEKLRNELMTVKEEKLNLQAQLTNQNSNIQELKDIIANQKETLK
ncbi:hypothetical protein [Desulfoscipio geothermicus]|uniref:Uncharacterized protein n=1 Tax=Desulfoscipio geothermicus DSM 3669 TaxID=1121426 RepID=A0A1I6E3V3_9FIRM|nr:hypothetical protein [Desulfoscipio geothermicus]SFR12440.1 hypothetical protein SAMN05660706_12528 [Desulfoscipio geothermicus DSM 3669]